MKKTDFVSALLPVCAIAASGCLCSRERTDEERLAEQLDTTAVHVYVALKVALTSGADDPATREASQRARALLEKLRTSRSGGGEGAEVGVGDAVALAKALWGLRETGARIARGEGEEAGVLLPAVLARAGAPPELVAAIDANAEHALFLVVLSVLKVHPRSPVPVPEEIVLYEAWKTDPPQVAIPGAAATLHAVKAWVYGNNGYCDLAESETTAVERAGLDSAELTQGLALLGMTGRSEAGGAVDDLSWVGPMLELVGHGAVAICNLDRGDDPKARAATRRFIASAREAGLAGEELEFLEAYVECGEGQAEAGRARLKKIAAARGGSEAQHEDLQMLGAYCEAADATSNETLRKVVLAAKLAGLAFGKLQQSGAAEELERTDVYRAVEDVAATRDALGLGGG